MTRFDPAYWGREALERIAHLDRHRERHPNDWKDPALRGPPRARWRAWMLGALRQSWACVGDACGVTELSRRHPSGPPLDSWRVALRCAMLAREYLGQLGGAYAGLSDVGDSATSLQNCLLDRLGEPETAAPSARVGAGVP